MIQDTALLEPMDMPNPYFPIKVHRQTSDEYGKIMFHNHWHKHIELLLCMSGKAVVECNSVPFTMESGDLIVLNGNDLHAGVSASKDLFYYAVIFDPALLHSPIFDASETKFITPITKNLIMFTHKIAGDLEMNACVLSIVQELKAEQLGYEVAVKSHLFRLFTLLLRKYVAHVQTMQDQHERLAHLKRFAPVLHYIELNYCEELSVDSLAGLAQLSRFHFSRQFKKLTGRTITEYVNGRRIAQAEYLLYNTRLTVSEIALATGFRDIYYFSRMFKKLKEAAPTEMRRNRTQS